MNRPGRRRRVEPLERRPAREGLPIDQYLGLEANPADDETTELVNRLLAALAAAGPPDTVTTATLYLLAQQAKSEGVSLERFATWAYRVFAFAYEEGDATTARVPS
jgi:hypothetical protein